MHQTVPPKLQVRSLIWLFVILGQFLLWTGCDSGFVSPSSETEPGVDSLQRIEHETLPIDVEEPASLPQPTATAEELEALLDRLHSITTIVAESPERRVYGVHFPANLQADERSPRWVHEVVMNVNVYWCDDGCVDGPAETPVTDADLLLLRPFAESLRSLDVQHTEITDDGLQTIGELNELVQLDLSGTAIQGSGLNQLDTLHKLQSLDLRETALLPEHVQSLRVLKSLEEIQLPTSAISDESLFVLGQLPNLKRLNLSTARVTDRGLSHLRPLKHLESLDLSETKITDDCLRALSRMTHLKFLNLAKTSITGAGLEHLAGLRHIQELNLEKTAIDDADLVHLSGLADLQTLNLSGTSISGQGLIHLKRCRSLGEVSLPPIYVSALTAVNTVKSWQRLSLTLVRTNDPTFPTPASAAAFNDMPKLTQLRIIFDCPLEELRIENCPQLAAISIEHAVLPLSHGNGSIPQSVSQSISQSHAQSVTPLKHEPLLPTSLHMRSLPALRALNLTGWFDALNGDDVLENVSYVSLNGSLTTETIRGIRRCRGLVDLNLRILQVTGDPLSEKEQSEFPLALKVRVSATKPTAAPIVSLIGHMPMLKHLDLQIPGLNSQILGSLTNCTKLEQLTVRGIDDPGEPLACLNAMPDLDQCLILGSPRVGLIRLTSQAGVRRLYFKYGRLDTLEIDGPPNLTAIYLGHEATAGAHFGQLRLARQVEFCYT